MKLLRLPLLATSLLLAVQTASAIPFSDVNDYVTAQNPNGQYVSWNALTPFSDWFDIIPDGYNPSTMAVVSATVSFWFHDNEDDWFLMPVDPVVVDLGAFTLGGELSHLDVDFTTQIGDTYVGGNILASLQDGDLSFRVHGLGADFYLTKAQLNAEAVSTAVPDGGMTAAMLGLALLGTAAVRRRFGR